MSTTIQLSEDLIKRLQILKSANDTYEDVIWQLVEEKLAEEKENSGAGKKKQYLRLTDDGWVEVSKKDT